MGAAECGQGSISQSQPKSQWLLTAINFLPLLYRFYVRIAEQGAQYTLEVAEPYPRGAMHTKPRLEKQVCCALVPAHPGVKPFRHHCLFLSPTVSALWICFPQSRSLRPRRIQSRNTWLNVWLQSQGQAFHPSEDLFQGMEPVKEKTNGKFTQTITRLLDILNFILLFHKLRQSCFTTFGALYINLEHVACFLVLC